MFHQADAPLKVLDHPSLGDAALIFHEPGDRSGAKGPEVELLLSGLYAQILDLDTRLHTAETAVTALQTRVQALEGQTARAYWDRGVAWLRSLWPWP